MIVNCWRCNKKHDIKYKIGKPVFCKCGGTVLSNSGKVMAGVKEWLKDDKNNEKSIDSKTKKTRENK